MPRKIFPEVIVKQNVQSVFKSTENNENVWNKLQKKKTPSFSQDIVFLFCLG